MHGHLNDKFVVIYPDDGIDGDWNMLVTSSVWRAHAASKHVPFWLGIT